METAIVSIICIALIVVGGMSMSKGFLSSVDTTTAGLETISDKSEEIMRTDLATLNAGQSAADTLEVALRNNGQTKLASFANWDFIIQYHDMVGGYQVKWLPYTDGTLGNNEWKKQGIYLDAETKTAEAFEPGILNPGEEMIVEAKLIPFVAENTTNLVVISTANGIPASIGFTGYSP